MTPFQYKQILFDVVYAESVVRYLTTLSIPTDISSEYYCNALMLNCAAEAHNYTIQFTKQQPTQ